MPFASSLTDLDHALQAVQLLEAKSQTAGTIKTAWLDTQGADEVFLQLNMGVYTKGGGSTVTWSLVECDTTADGSATAVDITEQEGTCSSATGTTNDQFSGLIRYTGSKRYVAVNVVVSASSTSVLVGVDGLTSSSDAAYAIPAAVART